MSTLILCLSESYFQSCTMELVKKGDLLTFQCNLIILLTVMDLKDWSF